MRIAETIAGSASIKRAISGAFISVKSASAELIISGKNIEPVHIGAGETYPLGEQYKNKEITIKNSSTASNTFVMEITTQPLQKSNVNNLTVNTTATIQIGDDNQHLDMVSVPAGGSAVLTPGNGLRRFLRIAIKSDAANEVTLGKSGVAATSGGLLEPGMVDYMETEGALWAFNPGAAPVDVYLMEINKL